MKGIKKTAVSIMVLFAIVSVIAGNIKLEQKGSCWQVKTAAYKIKLNEGLIKNIKVNGTDFLTYPRSLPAPAYFQFGKNWRIYFPEVTNIANTLEGQNKYIRLKYVFYPSKFELHVTNKTTKKCYLGLCKNDNVQEEQTATGTNWRKNQNAIKISPSVKHYYGIWPLWLEGGETKVFKFMITSSSKDVCQTDLSIKLASTAMQKDISKSLVGLDGEDFACGFDFNWMLTEGRNEFSKVAKKWGLRLIRFAEFDRYNPVGKEASCRLRAFPRKPRKKEIERYKHWFSVDDYWSFCKENNIKVISMFAGRKFYDTKSGQIKSLGDEKNFLSGAENAANYLKWLKSKNYLDLAVCWEIGNESYSPWAKDPDGFASWVKTLTKEVKKVQPDIKLSVPIFICRKDNPDVKNILAKINFTKNNSKEFTKYNEMALWSSKVIKALENEAKDIDYACFHSYGAEPGYISNYKGINLADKLIQAHSNSKHWRLINTEWRERSSEDLTCHRNFRQGAIWRASFLKQFIAYPNMDYTAAHSIFAFSGAFYWSNGKKWIHQRPGNYKEIKRGSRVFVEDKNNPDGKPRFDIGPFAPVMKMYNEMIETHPIMISNGASIPKYKMNMASAFFYLNIKEKVRKITYLEWLICRNKANDSISAVFVNTDNFSIKVDLSIAGKKIDLRKAKLEQLTCPLDKIDMIEYPGYKKLWKYQVIAKNNKDILEIPGMSVVRITVPTK